MKVSKAYIKLLIFTISLSFIVPNVLISKKSNLGQFPKHVMPYIDNVLLKETNNLSKNGTPFKLSLIHI